MHGKMQNNNATKKSAQCLLQLCHATIPTTHIGETGANFTNRLKLSQLSLCVGFKPQTDLSLFVKLAPGL